MISTTSETRSLAPNLAFPWVGPKQVLLVLTDVGCLSIQNSTNYLSWTFLNRHHESQTKFDFSANGTCISTFPFSYWTSLVYRWLVIDYWTNIFPLSYSDPCGLTRYIWHLTKAFSCLTLATTIQGKVMTNGKEARYSDSQNKRWFWVKYAEEVHKYCIKNPCKRRCQLEIVYYRLLCG